MNDLPAAAVPCSAGKGLLPSCPRDPCCALLVGPTPHGWLARVSTLASEGARAGLARLWPGLALESMRRLAFAMPGGRRHNCAYTRKPKHCCTHVVAAHDMNACSSWISSWAAWHKHCMQTKPCGWAPAAGVATHDSHAAGRAASAPLQPQLRPPACRSSMHCWRCPAAQCCFWHVVEHKSQIRQGSSWACAAAAPCATAGGGGATAVATATSASGAS